MRFEHLVLVIVVISFIFLTGCTAPTTQIQFPASGYSYKYTGLVDVTIRFYKDGTYTEDDIFYSRNEEYHYKGKWEVNTTNNNIDVHSYVSTSVQNLMNYNGPYPLFDQFVCRDMACDTVVRDDMPDMIYSKESAL